MSPPSFRQLCGIPNITASPTDSALIIIDAQKEYATGALAVTNISNSVPVIAELLSRYRKAHGKIVHVLHRVPEGAPVFTPGTPLAEEMDEVKAIEGETVVGKMFPGAFEGTELDQVLKGWGVEKVVLVGYMAHVCVSTTAREAMQKGYQVVLVEDGIGDRDIPGARGEEVKKMVLLELADVFGSVVKSVEIQ